MEKYHIERNTVQETLVIPLYGRKVCAERFPELFEDREAARLCDSLDYDFTEKGKAMESVAGLFGALEVAQRYYDLLWEIKIISVSIPRQQSSTWAAGWMTPSARLITASAGVITLTFLM